jgi:rubrerythrin
MKYVILEKTMSKIPIEGLEEVAPKDLDNEILRASIIAEFDAINLYEQMAAMTDNKRLKRVLLDIAKEEKTHVGEFQALLVEGDKEHKRELIEGKKEVGLIKAKGGFKLARMKMGEEESKTRKKEGEWTPSRERLRELARRRKKEQEAPEF